MQYTKYSPLYPFYITQHLSAVKIILLSSFLNSLMALYSSLVIFTGGFCVFFSAFLTSTLNSSAYPWLNLEKASSIATMYSPIGGCLGLMANLGPLASRCSLAPVNGVFDKFLTHVDVLSASISVASLV